jgi:hypothetical protein
MPGKKHLRGVGSKEQGSMSILRKILKKRAAEVAARTVLKQHKEKGHSKGT